MAKPAYKRVLLKISGEALMGDQGFGINPEVLTTVATEIADTAKLGVKSRSWSAAAISFAASRRAAWIARPAITSACSRP